jgi:hypothetical protein
MKHHRFDPISFLFGALFLTVGTTFLFGESGAGAALPVRLWAPLVVVIGATLAIWALSAAVRSVRRPAAETPAGEDIADADRGSEAHP